MSATVELPKKVYRHPGDPAPRDHRWRWASHLSALIYLKGHRSWTSAAKAVGLPVPSLTQIISHRVPMEQTVDQIMIGLGATREELYRALDDFPIDKA